MLLVIKITLKNPALYVFTSDRLALLFSSKTPKQQNICVGGNLYVKQLSFKVNAEHLATRCLCVCLFVCFLLINGTA